MRALVVFLSLCILSCNEIDNTSHSDIYDLDNSTVKITNATDHFYLKRCEVRKHNDSLYFNFSDTVKHSNWYELQIVQVDNDFYSNFYNTFSITDSSYKPPVFTTYYQSIQLDKTNYQIGDSIKGTVSMNISSYNLWPEVFTDTFTIAGEFRTIVK